MGTPDRFPGALFEEELILEPRTSDPTEAGALRYRSDTGAFAMRDATGVFDPRTGGSGLTEGQHEVLDTLVHELAETSFLEVTRSAGQVITVIVWTDSGKTTKVRETLVTRSGSQISQIVEKQYDAGGTLKQTLTHDITRSGGQVASIDTTES